MSKTPIMVLQEVAVKCNLSLGYRELPVQREGQQMVFTIRVTCNGHEENGVASTKKAAKHNAAAKMLVKLENGNIIARGSLRDMKVENPSCDSSINSSMDSSASINSEQSLSNYVGLLNEYCQANGLPLPTYDTSPMSGTANCPTFVISCSVGGTCLQGSAGTKKRAKQIASEKVFEALRGNPDMLQLIAKKNIDISSDETNRLVEKLGFEIGSLSVAQDKNVGASEIKLIESKYIKQRGKAQINLELMSEQHHKIRKLIESMSQMQKDHILLLQSKPTSTSKYVIENAICSALKVKAIDKFILRPRCRNVFMAGCKVSIDPPIVHIGIGVSIDSAELQALNKTLNLIVFYLKSA